MAKNTLTFPQRVAVVDALRQHRAEFAAEGTSHRRAALRLSDVLPFPVTEANVRTAADEVPGLQWEVVRRPPDNRKKGRQASVGEVICFAVETLYQRLGESVPDYLAERCRLIRWRLAGSDPTANGRYSFAPKESVPS